MQTHTRSNVDRLLHTPLCQTIAKILIFLMVIQGMPLWELSHAYHWDLQKFRKNLNSLVGIFGPKDVFGGTLAFGPKQYLRTKGKPNRYTDSFSATPGEGTLTVQNGDDNGKHRISSAIIVLNGTRMFGPKDFNQQVGNLEIPITMLEENSISLVLRSAPGSYLVSIQKWTVFQNLG